MGVMTVLGEIPVDKLGVTQMHEHILANADFEHNDQNMVIDEVDVAIEEIRSFKAAGGDTIVEHSCEGLGQDIVGLKEVSQKSGVHVVASTGYYRECSYPNYVTKETDKQLARRLVKNLTEGIEGTGIRPGILAEIATEYGVGKMSTTEKKVFISVAHAQVETGVPVSTHCWAGELAFDQIKLLTSNGVPPEKILIGHLAVDNGVKDRILRIADKGVYLGIDCIGFEYESVVGMKDRDKAHFVRELVDRGFLERIMISQDLMRKLYLKHYHGPGYDYLLLRFVPILLDEGLSRKEIDTMLMANPKTIFS